jgi:hypothetical protein
MLDLCHHTFHPACFGGGESRQQKDNESEDKPKGRSARGESEEEYEKGCQVRVIP